jgi:serine/threonine protein kinase
MPKTQPARPDSADAFLRLVLRSGLLDRTQLQTALRSVPPDQRDQPEILAQHLTKLGKLSRFQAAKLLKGTFVGLVLGPFQVLAPIGRGGMGTVYLARDSRSGQLLALKVLPPKRAREEQRVLARFRREMEMSRRVAHPHLAWTYEVGLCQGVYYIAMEYIPGKSLHRLVAEGGPLEVPRAARLLAEVAGALDHTHNQGLVHRDIKPANILVTPNDHAKVLDLGLALVRGEKGGDREVVGGSGYVVGTMDFIAPEQIANPLEVDGRADVYALGCTLYYTVGGRLPFPGGSSKEKMQRQLEDRPTPLRELNPAVPEAFAAVVERMMAKEPGQRYPSAAEVEEELRRWESGPPALPLDRPGDTAYEIAVADLEAAEPAPEEIEDPILVGVETPELIEAPILLEPGDFLDPNPSLAQRWRQLLAEKVGPLTGLQWVAVAGAVAGGLLLGLILYLCRG